MSRAAELGVERMIYDEKDVEETPALRRLRDKLTKENLWLYIIRLLRERPMYAYEVKTKLGEEYGIRASTVTVYTVLYRMVREGLLETFTAEDGTKYYRVTKKGLRAFEQAIRWMRCILSMLSAGLPADDERQNR